MESLIKWPKVVRKLKEAGSLFVQPEGDVVTLDGQAID
jgi:hypothetical protein